MIDPTHGVIIKNPNYSQKYIHSVVEKKLDWIVKKLLHLDKRKSISEIYNREKKVLFLGKKEPLHVKGNLSSFYKQKTVEIVPILVDKWALKMKLTPTKISFRKTKRRWGSCSVKNELSFTSSLSQLPLECIEYIIVHELSHIKHKNHKKDFWLLVEKFMPNYKKYEKILKEYSPQI
jgi:predicted metal-dependent hydrolase